MAVILDTNVISELLRPVPNAHVVAWLSAQNSATLYFTTVGEAELRRGVMILPAGKRRDALSNAIDGIMEEDFRERVLSFDRSAALAFGVIAAARSAAGKPISQFDCQIAAIASIHGAALATRNTRDFTGCGLELIDPWQALPPT